MSRWEKVKQVAEGVWITLMFAGLLFGCLALAGLAGRDLLAAVGVHLMPTFDPEKFELAEWAWLLGHAVGLLLIVCVIGLAGFWLRRIYVVARGD